MAPRFAPPSPEALPLHVVSPDSLDGWLERQPGPTAGWVRHAGFAAAPGATLLLPDAEGRPAGALIGRGSEAQRVRSRFDVGAAVATLPEGAWAFGHGLAAEDAAEAGLGYLLACYRFTRYREGPPAAARLVAPAGVDTAQLEAIAAGEWLTRDLINTPASDMGPAELEAAARELAEETGAAISVTTGEALLDANLPMIHAVGRASPRAPRLVDMRWGSDGPTLTLVGKGVCFDTGGLNLKPGASMGLMKKDMGGAATVLGLAATIMRLALPVRLRVLIPAVENAVSGSAMRPGDILTSRKGLTVEINNTDAEGRLVLADALALADEAPADLTVSMATLTGAARVAVGPDIAPFFTDNAPLAEALALAGDRVRDPVWRLPFHPGYEPMIELQVADLDNAPKGGMAGAITAALFLRRFVSESPRYVHFDVYGWQPSPAPGRPKGGVGQGARALLEALPEVLGL